MPCAWPCSPPFVSFVATYPQKNNASQWSMLRTDDAGSRTFSLNGPTVGRPICGWSSRGEVTFSSSEILEGPRRTSWYAGDRIERPEEASPTVSARLATSPEVLIGSCRVLCCLKKSLEVSISRREPARDTAGRSMGPACGHALGEKVPCDESPRPFGGPVFSAAHVGHRTGDVADQPLYLLLQPPLAAHARPEARATSSHVGGAQHLSEVVGP